MRHSAVGLTFFSDLLKKSLSNRIDEFVSHMDKELIENPEKCMVKSQRQWMLEYKKWVSNDEKEKVILRYLLDEGDINEDS